MLVMPFAGLFDGIFGRKKVVRDTVAEKIDEDLQHAQMDLLKAQKERQYWTAMEVMLVERVTLLKQQDIKGVIP